jgi:DNA-binding transcriptional LysR family regulator
MQVSRRIAALEEDLGVRLFHRTTRSLTLTAEGEAFVPYARTMVDAETGARAELSPSPKTASGILRMTAPSGFGQSIVLPMLPRLLESNPELRIDLDLSDRQVDVVGQGLDLALRIAPLEDSELIARKIAPNPRLICAAPAYLKKHGLPKTVSNLDEHRCVRLYAVGRWPLIVDGVLIRKRIEAYVTTTSVEAARTAAMQGLGLTMLTYWDVFRQLADKSLVEVQLQDASMENLSAWAIMPSRRYVPHRVSVFLAALEGEIAHLARTHGQ